MATLKDFIYRRKSLSKLAWNTREELGFINGSIDIKVYNFGVYIK